MAKYDAGVIQAFADDLYRRADTIVIVNALIFLVVGGAAGLAAFGKLGALLGALIGGGIGYYLGVQRAFLLKLQAQTALCQAQIERNTQSSNNGQTTVARTSVAGLAKESTNLSSPSEPDPLVPEGTCPNCKATIPLASEDCPKCKANFSIGSSWKVQPVR
jgi:hypothetical protein